MTIVNTETGEITQVVDLDRAAAERRAERIVTRLDAIAENYTRVLPMIREAIEKRDDLALGYRSPGDYVSDRFGQSLAGLGIEVRREFVRELTDAGMSTRAIAPVVGVSKSQVATDAQVSRTGHLPQAPGPTIPPGEPVSRDVGSGPLVRPTVVGIDGKAYSRPVPQPKSAPSDRRRPLPDTARDLGIDLRKVTDRIERLAADDRLGRNRNEVAAHLRHHLAHALKALADLDAELNSHEGA